MHAWRTGHAQGKGQGWLGAVDLGTRRADEAGAQGQPAAEQIALAHVQPAPQGGGVAGAQVDGIEDDGAAFLDLDDQHRSPAALALDHGQACVEKIAQRQQAQPRPLHTCIVGGDRVAGRKSRFAQDEVRAGLAVAAHLDALDGVAGDEPVGLGGVCHDRRCRWLCLRHRRHEDKQRQKPGEAHGRATDSSPTVDRHKAGVN